MSAAAEKFTQLDVEGFTLWDGKDATRHFEKDPNLFLRLNGGGTQRGAVLVTLGIDDYDCHRVEVNHTPGGYDDAKACIDDAIEVLEVMRDQLELMRSVPDARGAERNAFELGADAQRAGLVPRVSA